MRIGIFCDAIGLGGSQNTAASLAMAMKNAGHEVTLYVDSRRFRSGVRWRELNLVDLPVNLLCPDSLGSLSLRNFYSSLVSVAKRKHDVLLSVSSRSLPLVMVCSVVFRVPCLLYMVAPYMHISNRMFWGLTVANSEETRDMLAEWLRRPRDSIPVIRARVAVDHFASPTDRTASDDVQRILLLSRLETSKTRGVIKTIDAFAILCETHGNIVLEICGGGQDYDGIAHQADRVNCRLGREAIRLLGPVEDVYSHILRTDIVIGLGRSAWEAMACGKPTVVVGKEGLGGVVCEENLSRLMYHNFTARGHDAETGASEIAAALAPLLASSERRSELGRFAISVVREHYDVAKGASQFIGIFHDILETDRGRRRNTFASLVGVLVTWLEPYCRALSVWFVRPRSTLLSVRRAIHLGRPS